MEGRRKRGAGLGFPERAVERTASALKLTCVSPPFYLLENKRACRKIGVCNEDVYYSRQFRNSDTVKRLTEIEVIRKERVVVWFVSSKVCSRPYST